MKVDWVPIGDVLEMRRVAVDIDPLQEYRRVGIYSWGKGAFVRDAALGSELGKLNYFATDRSALIVSNIQAWEGAVALASDALAGSVASNRFLQYLPRPGVQVCLPYVTHYLKSGAGLDLLRRASPGTQVRNRTLGRKAFERELIPLPSLVDQRRIAHHLDGIAAVQAASASESNGGQSLREVEQSLISELSRRCEQVSLGQLVEQVVRKSAVEDNRYYDMMGVRWYGAGAFVRETRRGESLSARAVFRVESGDLVYNRLFAWKESFALAERSGMHASGEFPTFRVNSDLVVPEVLLALLLAPEFTRQVDAASTGSTPTSRNRLKVPAFLHLTVPLPPRSAQDFIRRQLGIIRSARQTAQRAQFYRDALLPAARNEVFSQLTR